MNNVVATDATSYRLSVLPDMNPYNTYFQLFLILLGISGTVICLSIANIKDTIIRANHHGHNASKETHLIAEIRFTSGLHSVDEV